MNMIAEGGYEFRERRIIRVIGVVPKETDIEAYIAMGIEKLRKRFNASLRT